MATKLPRKAAPTLRAYPNPYKALDHEGRPASAVLCDPVDHVPYGSDAEMRRYVGATLVVEELKPAGRHTPAVHDRGWEFAFEPVVLPKTDYYRQRIFHGDLVAADVATWVAIGGDRASFRDPLVVLAEAKESAIGHHVREHGAEAVPSETHAHWAEHLPDLAAKRAAEDKANADRASGAEEAHR